MMKWVLTTLIVILVGLAAYAAHVSRVAQKVVRAVEGPPLLQADVDFSKPFTNEFNIHHTVKPMYGTIYLTLKVDPWPKEWNDWNMAGEELEEAHGHMRIYGTSNVLADERRLNWFYSSIARAEPKTAPLQGLPGRLPLGEYRLVIATTNGLAKLTGFKQQLVVRYDLIHERTIATVGRNLAIIFGCAALLATGLLICMLKEHS